MGSTIRVGAAAIVLAMPLLLAACTNGGKSQASTTTIPPASAAQTSATRSYLDGKGRSLITLDDLAATLAQRRSMSACRTNEKTVVRLTRDGRGPTVADPGLA